MERYTRFLQRHRILVLCIFLAGMALCVPFSLIQEWSGSFTDYLSADAEPARALEVMEEEFGQTVPSLRVLVYGVSIPEALEKKEQLQAAEGVQKVDWLDDVADLHEPLELADEKSTGDWYAEGNACYSVTVAEGREVQAVAAIRELIGPENGISGPAAEKALTRETGAGELVQVLLWTIPILLVLLVFATQSWLEPVLILFTAGAAVLLNQGTNVFLGELSVLTGAVVPLLQGALCVGEGLFLLRRYAAQRKEKKPEEAMQAAVAEASGGLLGTTLAAAAGIPALCVMKFGLGRELGIALGKGILLDLLVVLVLLPALSVTFRRAVEKTAHRPFGAGGTGLQKMWEKLCFLLLILTVVLLPVSFLAQSSNIFLYGDSGLYGSEKTRLGRDRAAVEELFGHTEVVVLLVPRDSTPMGDLQKEAALTDELEKLDYVTSVISYGNTVGNGVPEEYVEGDVRSALHSAYYSRFVIRLDTGEQDPDWVEKVDGVRNVGEKYFGDNIRYGGDLVSTEELCRTLEKDDFAVSFLAAAAVFIISAICLRSLSVPLLITVTVQTAVWINLAIPYFSGTALFHAGYTAAEGLLAGMAWVCAIPPAAGYLKARKSLPKREAVAQMWKETGVPLLLSAAGLATGGVLLSVVSVNEALRQLGIFLGRGALLSAIMALGVLPALFLLCDKGIGKTTLGADFFQDSAK